MSRSRKKNPIVKDKNKEEQRNAHGRVRAKERDILNGVDINTADDVVIPDENNTDAVRLQISQQVNNYLDTVQVAGGLVSFDVIIDRSNNTDDLIGQDTALLDVLVEIPGVISKFINRVTILGSGGATSAGFVAV